MTSAILSGGGRLRAHAVYESESTPCFENADDMTLPGRSADRPHPDRSAALGIINDSATDDATAVEERVLRRGVSVKWMLGLTAFAGVASAALIHPDSYWAPLLTNLNVAAQLAAVLGWIFARGPARAFAIGFALCNGLFLVLEFVPEWGRPLIQNMLPWALWSPESSLLLGEPTMKRAFLGLVVSGFIYGYGGGWLARRLYLRFARNASV